MKIESRLIIPISIMLYFQPSQIKLLFADKCILLCSDTCLGVVWWCSEVCHAWKAWYQLYRNLYFYTFENCLNACMIILVTYKLKRMMKQMTQITVSDLCHTIVTMTQEWQECYSCKCYKSTNLVTSRIHRSNTKRISSFGETMVTFQLSIRFEKFIFINFD